MAAWEQCESKTKVTHPTLTRMDAGFAALGKSVNSFLSPVRVCVCVRRHTQRVSFSLTPSSQCAGAEKRRRVSLSREGVLKLFTPFPKEGEPIRTGLSVGWVISIFAKHPSQSHPHPPIGSSSEAANTECSSPIGALVAGWAIS